MSFPHSHQPRRRQQQQQWPMGNIRSKPHQVPVLPDEILEDIFVRLDDAADLARAPAACKTHRRVVCNPWFLRRYRFLHPPPVLGFLASTTGTWNGGFHPAEAPHKSALAGASLAQAADFTFSFLPMDPNANSSGDRSWCICDARDGRVLLSRRSADDGATFLELVICDPLYREYIQIPPIPEDLWAKRYSTEMESEPFLLPAREEEDESLFQVVYNWVSLYKIITFLYNSKTGIWSLATSFNFLPERLIANPMNFVRHYVGSCFYWVDRSSSNYMLVLDPLEMAFSIARLPYGIGDNLQGLAVVDAGVNRLGIVVIRCVGNLDLHSRTWQNSTEEWQHDKHDTLPDGYKECRIIGAAKGCLVLEDRSVEMIQYLIMDPKTFLVERFCKCNLVYAVDRALPYARYPPSLSAPSI